MLNFIIIFQNKRKTHDKSILSRERKKIWRFIEVIKNVNDRFGTVSSVLDSFIWLVNSSICVLVNWLCLWLVARCIFYVNCLKHRTFSIKNTIFRFEESHLFAKQSTCIYWIFNDLRTVELALELFNNRRLIIQLTFDCLFLTWTAFEFFVPRISWQNGKERLMTFLQTFKKILDNIKSLRWRMKTHKPVAETLSAHKSS